MQQGYVALTTLCGQCISGTEKSSFKYEIFCGADQGSILAAG